MIPRKRNPSSCQRPTTHPLDSTYPCFHRDITDAVITLFSFIATFFFSTRPFPWRRKKISIFPHPTSLTLIYSEQNSKMLLLCLGPLQLPPILFLSLSSVKITKCCCFAKCPRCFSNLFGFTGWYLIPMTSPPLKPFPLCLSSSSMVFNSQTHSDGLEVWLRFPFPSFG